MDILNPSDDLRIVRSEILIDLYFYFLFTLSSVRLIIFQTFSQGSTFILHKLSYTLHILQSFLCFCKHYVRMLLAEVQPVPPTTFCIESNF